jgi:peroxiredoxin
MKRLIFILVLLSLISCIKEKQTGADLVVGDTVPNFTVIMNDGTQVTGKEIRQGKACVVFFTTVCSDCKATLPHLQMIYDEYHSKGVQFALISREEGQESVSKYWEEQKFTMPYSAQIDRKVYELFAKTRVQRVYICKDGVIKAIFTDQPQNPDYDTIKAAIENL